MRTATMSLILAGAFVAILLVAAFSVIRLDRDGVRGTLVGAGLGLLNLVVGYLATRRTLRRGMKSAMTLVAGGFIARLIVLVVLMVAFQRTGVADPAAFALTFLIFFFVYLGLEVLLVGRSLDAPRSAQ